MTEEESLMQAISNVNQKLNKTGLDYESYLQNMGRQLFYMVATSYVTIYLVIIFLIIANTMIGVQFLLGQIVSNSIKYCREKPKLWFEFKQEENCFVLKIRDNGIGVRSCDLPYIFDKGFTGDSGENRKKATGMGLYLARGIAQDLNLSLEVDAEWGKGFEIRILFPIVIQGERAAFH